MKTRITLAAVALGALVAGQARAQESSWATRQLPAPSGAFELSLSTGYTQPFGQLAAGVGMPSVARSGVAAELDVGFRATPHWSFALGAQYQELNAERSFAARGGTGTLLAAYHFDPDRRLDPWFELGGGYRALWEPQGANNGPTIFTHGVQLARVRVGLDFRGTTGVAIAPVVGADATLFLWQDAGTSTAITDPRLSTFVFAGAQGRFDIGGNTVGTTYTTSATYRHE
jgi:hypothetical protein